MKNRTAGNTHAKSIKSIIALCICMIVSFFMWVYVMTVDSPDYEEVFEGVTVQLTGTDSLAERDLAIFNGYGVKIDVTLAGKKSILSRIRAEELIATADVSAVSESGRYNIKLFFDTPAGCKMIGMSQDTVSVYVDTSAQKIVGITERRENMSLPESCFTGEIIYPFDKVTVSGPLDILNRVEGASVVLDMSNITKTTTVVEKIVLVDGSGATVENPYIDYYPKEITLEIPILKTVKVPLEVQYRYGFLSESNTVVKFMPEYVEATGDSEIISRGDLVAPIVIDEKTAFDNGWYDSIVSLEPIDGIELSSQKVKVSIELSGGYAVREFTVPQENVFPSGANDGVSYSWRSVPVSVTLLGPSDVLGEISGDDISIVFDMSAYSDTNVGTVRVRADVIVNSDLYDDVLVAGQYYINVTFEKTND